MSEIVVGPQGVFEAAQLTGTNTGSRAGALPSGLSIDLEVLILFPWDRERRLLRGEKIWLDSRGSLLPAR